jgi:hypothetical protein
MDARAVPTLLSASVLFYSTLLQLQWQRTQAKHDEESAAPPPAATTAPALQAVLPAAPSGSASTPDEEALNVVKFREVRRENAIRPFFGLNAFRLFVLGFFISVVSSALDLLAHGLLREFLHIARYARGDPRANYEA